MRGIGGRVIGWSAFTPAAVLAAAVLAGCGGGGTGAAGPPVPATPAAVTTAAPGTTGGTTAAPTAGGTGGTASTPPSPGTTVDATSGTAPPSPRAATPAPASGALLRPGASGAAVLALQRRLTELGYWVGTPDGHYGDVTVQAVTALQKVAGLGRDGVLGPRTRAALDRGVRPTAVSTKGHVIEIDLRHQVLLVVDGGTVTRVVNVSTGSGAYYRRPNGTTGHAVTPTGHYTVLRGVDGWDTSPLGHLYRPRYFNGGIAVHGYPSVPSVPASHGCVRVSLPAMDMIWSGHVMPVKAAVWVY